MSNNQKISTAAMTRSAGLLVTILAFMSLVAVSVSLRSIEDGNEEQNIQEDEIEEKRLALLFPEPVPPEQDEIEAN